MSSNQATDIRVYIFSHGQYFSLSTLLDGGQFHRIEITLTRLKCDPWIAIFQELKLKMLFHIHTGENRFRCDFC